ncbi:protein FANTASTIC FOUR 2-like [Rutidosis leptorrhynchoides]|uniref:protein FANTASTIC FOUR 2-like n=1 Tax=Rutidosis leptorrhynchoides TaxID=125765 RepID=UPI003A9A1F7F
MDMVVCQGLQSCLDPIKIDALDSIQKSSSKPIILVHKSKLEANLKSGETVNNTNKWSFLSLLEKPSSNVVKTEEIYVHPMVKRSASTLSTMSLEMCTESLGTETGSDVSESSDEFSLQERERFGGLQISKFQNFDRRMLSHHSRVNGGFPPPLTSISGSDGIVKVRPHREGGRLVIKAVSVFDCGIKFEEERMNGKLKLSLFKDNHVNTESGRAKVKNQDIEERRCDGVVDQGGSRRCEMNGNKRKFETKTRIRLPKRMTRLPSSFNDKNESKITKCTDRKNKNKVIRNLSLFRVVIS